jgi:hypothetical protein
VKPMTQVLIRKYLGDVKMKRRILGGRFIWLPSGATVIITRNRIDFGKYRLPENRKDIDEDKFQEEVWECLNLGQEVWGGIGVYGDGSREDRAIFLRNLESVGIKTGDQGLILKHFGPEATIKYFRPGWEVKLPNGSGVKVRGAAIEEVTGGAEIFRSALMLLNEIAPGNVVVRGNQELILAGLQHAATLGIQVIPEQYPERMYALIAAVVQIACIALALIWMTFWDALVVGWVAGTLLCMLANRVFWKRMMNDARKRGQNLNSKWPSVHGGERKASVEDAKAKGMI